MAQFLPAPIVPRPRRVAAFLLSALLIAAAGCGHHKRTSLRPVYPAPVASPCPSGDCGGSAVPLSPAPAASVEPTLVNPAPGALAPGASLTPRGLSSPVTSAPVSSTPINTGPASDTPPPVTPPSLKGFSDEPGLEPAGAEEPSKVSPPKGAGVSKGASARAPSPGAAVRSGVGTGKKSAGPRVRQASAAERLRPFVGDPDDVLFPPRADKPWKYIVLHHSASPTGGYDVIDREHRERLGWQGCGYHFVIGNGTDSPDGRIEVSQRWANQKNGVHCRDGKNPDVNEYGIGICLVGDLEKAPPTDLQVAAARELVSYLSTRYRIAADHAETHAHLAASPTSCPGRHFPAQAILGAQGLVSR